MKLYALVLTARVESVRLMNTIREWRKKIQCAEIREMFLSTQCDSHSQYDLVQELQALKVDTYIQDRSILRKMRIYGESSILYKMTLISSRVYYALQ